MLFILFIDEFWDSILIFLQNSHSVATQCPILLQSVCVCVLQTKFIAVNFGCFDLCTLSCIKLHVSSGDNDEFFSMLDGTRITALWNGRAHTITLFLSLCFDVPHSFGWMWNFFRQNFFTAFDCGILVYKNCGATYQNLSLIHAANTKWSVDIAIANASSWILIIRRMCSQFEIENQDQKKVWIFTQKH